MTQNKLTQIKLCIYFKVNILKAKNLPYMQNNNYKSLFKGKNKYHIKYKLNCIFYQYDYHL